MTVLCNESTEPPLVEAPQDRAAANGFLPRGRRCSAGAEGGIRSGSEGERHRDREDPDDPRRERESSDRKIAER